MGCILNKFGKGKLLVAFGMASLLCISVGCSRNDSNDATRNPAMQPEKQVGDTSVTADSVIEQNETKTAVKLQTVPSDSAKTMLGEDAAHTSLAADTGQKRYEATCKICHDAGLLQAPKRGDKAAWQPRIAKGVDTLHKHSAEGYNKMPAQANDNVSKEEVYAAVDYLIAQSS